MPLVPDAGRHRTIRGRQQPQQQCTSSLVALPFGGNPYGSKSLCFSIVLPGVSARFTSQHKPFVLLSCQEDVRLDKQVRNPGKAALMVSPKKLTEVTEVTEADGWLILCFHSAPQQQGASSKHRVCVALTGLLPTKFDR